MSPETKKKFGKPLVVRLEQSQQIKVEAVAAANDLSVSDIMRLAIRNCLPAIDAGRVKIRSSD